MPTVRDDTTAPRRDARAGPVVLQILPRLVTGGVERGCVDIAAAIVEAGGTALVASAGGPMVGELRRLKADHVVLPLASKNPLRIRRNVGRLAAVIDGRGVDLVHARSRAPAWSAYLACQRTGAPLVTTFHAPYNFRGPLKKRYNSIMARGRRVIAISEYVARHVRENYGVGDDRLRLIHRGVDLRRFDSAAVGGGRIVDLLSRWRVPDGAAVILMPGRLTAWKGQSVLLEAVARLARPDAYCVLVGSDQGRHGYRQELENRIRQLGIADRVCIADHCEDMPAAYKVAQVVVHASTEPEGFGRVLAEAQAMGRPVIASDLGAPPEIVRDGETGWLTPPGDPAALAAALGRALDLDADDRRRLGERAMARAREHFALAAMSGATLRVYDEVLAECGRRTFR